MISPRPPWTRSAVTTGEGLIREVGKIWQRLTKNSTLREHAVWKSGLNVFLADEEQLLDHFDSPRCRVWREREEALVTRGRDILGRSDESDSVVLPRVRDSVASEIREIEKVRLVRNRANRQTLSSPIK